MNPESHPDQPADAYPGLDSFQRILITGGAGFVGSTLADRLLALGKEVVVIDDLSTGSLANLKSAVPSERFTFWNSKVSDPSFLERAVEGVDLIFHLAAAVGVDLVVKSPIRTIETNLEETEVILETASRRKVPILITSTSEVYGKSSQEVFRETDDLIIGPPTLGRWSYACSKLMDEFLALAFVKERGLQAMIVRLFNTVGPRQTGRFGMALPRFIQSALKNEPIRIFGDGEQSRCFCYVNDTVEALIRLVSSTNAWGEIFNIGSEYEITIRGLAETVIQELNSKSALEFVPYEQAYGAGFEDMRRRRPSVDKLFEFTGFRPQTSLKELIRKTAESFS